MEKITTRVKKWGNSFGVIIPSEIAAIQNIKEGSELELTITPIDRMTVGDVFELSKKVGLKRKGKTQTILDDIDQELWPDGE